MSQDNVERISQISTMWSALREAHTGDPAAMQAAQQLLLERYGPPLQGYLARLAGDAETRDDLWQEFATRLIQGDFRNADPSKGRFRCYLKTVLIRMAHRLAEVRRNRATLSLDQIAPPADDGEDTWFDDAWGEHLMARTWRALRDARKPYEQLLRLRVEAPEASAAELAAAMQSRHGVRWTPETVRQTLRRARRRFGELLIHEVAHSVAPATRERVEEELAALGLLSHCKPWLATWPGTS